MPNTFLIVELINVFEHAIIKSTQMGNSQAPILINVTAIKDIYGIRKRSSVNLLKISKIHRFFIMAYN